MMKRLLAICAFGSWMLRNLMWYLGGAIVFGIGFLLFAYVYAHADIAAIGNLQSKKAVCCNEYDGRAPEAIWELSDGTIPNVHYKVQIEGYWVNVPDDAVLEVPNKFGTAVVWYSSTRYGNDKPPSFFIRCFLPGQLF